MRTMSKRFIKAWKRDKTKNWIIYAVCHDADRRCWMQPRVAYFVND